MERKFKDLDKLEKAFIDAVYIKFKTFKKAAEMLAIDK